MGLGGGKEEGRKEGIQFSFRKKGSLWNSYFKQIEFWAPSGLLLNLSFG